MTAKGQARGPNHYIDPPEGTVVQEPTGVEIRRSVPSHHSRGRFTHTANVIADIIGSGRLMTTYPLIQGKDRVKVADSVVHRLNQTGRGKSGMVLIERRLKSIFGDLCFEVCRVQAKMMQQADGSIKVMVRWVPLEEAAA